MSWALQQQTRKKCEREVIFSTAYSVNGVTLYNNLDRTDYMLFGFKVADSAISWASLNQHIASILAVKMVKGR